MDVVEPVGDVGLADEIVEQRDRRLDAVDDELRQRPLQPHHAFVARLAVHDQLADEAVVVGRDAIALVDAAVDAHAEAAGRMPIGDLARARGGRCAGSRR